MQCEKIPCARKRYVKIRCVRHTHQAIWIRKEYAYMVWVCRRYVESNQSQLVVLAHWIWRSVDRISTTPEFHSTENMRNWSLSVYVVNMNMSFHTYFGGCFANFNKFFLCHLFKIKIKWNCRDERLQWHWFLCTMAESSIVVWTNTKSESISYNQVRNGWTALHHSPHFIRVYRIPFSNATGHETATSCCYLTFECLTSSP